MKKKSVLKPILGLAIAGGLLVPTVTDVKAATVDPTKITTLQNSEYDLPDGGPIFWGGKGTNLYKTDKVVPGTIVGIFKKGTHSSSEGYFKEVFETGNTYVYGFADRFDAKSATNPYHYIETKAERYDRVNENNYSNFHLRYSVFVNNPTGNYYLTAHRQGAENFYKMEVRYYEGVNYLNLSKDDYSKVIDNYTPAQSKSIAGKSIVIPKNTNPYREPMARLIAKQDIPLLKKESNGTYTAVKMLEKGGFYRIYGIDGNLYNVGGAYYVPRNDALMSHFIGRLQVNKSVPMYNPSGQIHRYLTAGEAVRVFDYDNGKYDVGGGYYVLDSTKIQYFVGAITAKQNVSVFNANGKVAYTLKKGQRVFIERLEGNKAYIDGDTYIVHDKSKTTYSKS